MMMMMMMITRTTLHSVADVLSVARTSGLSTLWCKDDKQDSRRLVTLDWRLQCVADRRLIACQLVSPDLTSRRLTCCRVDGHRPMEWTRRCDAAGNEL